MQPMKSRVDNVSWKITKPRTATPKLLITFHNIFIIVSVSYSIDFHKIRGCMEYKIIGTTIKYGFHPLSIICLTAAKAATSTIVNRDAKRRGIEFICYSGGIKCKPI